MAMNLSCWKRASMGVVLAAVVGAVSPAVARHSFAMYEPTKTLTFKGTVKSFQWTNPHVILWVLVQPEGGGAPKEWSFETTSPGVLTRNDGTRQSLKTGDKWNGTSSPRRDGTR